MKRLVYSICRISLLFLIAILLIPFVGVDVFADETPYVIVSSYAVSGDTVVPGGEFDISITVQNADEMYTAKNVIVSVTTIDGISNIYPSVPQIFIGDIKPKEEKTAVFSYKMASSYSIDTASFYISIISDARTNSVILTAPVELDEAAFAILSKKIPTEAVAGDKISSSLYFRVKGDNSLNNVVMRVLIDDDETMTSSIGNVSSGASKTQNITFMIEEVGKHKLLFVLEGIDQNGTVQTTEVYSGEIEIKEQQGTNMNTDDGTVVNIRARRDYYIFAGCGCLVLGCLAGIVWILRKYK